MMFDTHSGRGSKTMKNNIDSIKLSQIIDENCLKKIIENEKIKNFN